MEKCQGRVVECQVEHSLAGVLLDFPLHDVEHAVGQVDGIDVERGDVTPAQARVAGEEEGPFHFVVGAGRGGQACDFVGVEDGFGKFVLRHHADVSCRVGRQQVAFDAVVQALLELVEISGRRMSREPSLQEFVELGSRKGG